MTKLIPPRKLRRKKAKMCGENFEPQYNGKAPISFAEYIGSLKRVPARLRKSPLNKTGI